MELFDIGAFVDIFFDGEKEGARQLIRHEMESMIDPLVESLFKQLKHKFVDYREASLRLNQEPQHAHDCEGNEQMIRDQETIFNAQQYHFQSLDNSHSIDANCQLNSTNHQPALNSIAHSITDPLNVQFEPQLNDHSINSSSSAQESTLSPSTSTDQTLSNTEIQQQHQLDLIEHNQFDDEEECDCDECVYGGIEEIKHEDEKDDDDSVQWVEESQEEGESSPPVKRPKMDTTQNEINAQTEVNGRQSPRQPTVEAQPNQVITQDKQILTVHFRCPDPNCPDTFTETELNDHLMDEHSIGPNRCLVKDCIQSFDNYRILGEHIKQVHQDISQWHCDKCVKHFAKYAQLSAHNYYHHQLGHFQCSFPSCTFTGEYRAKVSSHYRQHKPELVCAQSDCDYRTKNATRFKDHERAHLGIKPYRCKWSNCDYSSASRNTIMMHIKAHINTSSSAVALSHKPTDYLEVVQSLL